MLIQEALKQGDKIRRACWVNKDSYIRQNVFSLIFQNGNLFYPSKSDILATDWEIYREPIKLEVGRFYKTRSGDKAFIFYIGMGASPVSYVRMEHDGYYSCDLRGRTSKYYTSNLDIISEWEDSNE